MNDYSLNRLNMGRKVPACFDHADHLPLWQNQPPLRLATAIGEARAKLAGLETLAQAQTQVITGSAADKRREEKELEDAAHELARLVVRCCRAQGDETSVATYDLPLSGWRRMRDEILLQTARNLESKAGALAATPLGTDYGITRAAVAALKKEADDYAALIAAPDDATTKQVRPAFAAFEDQLQEIDDLVLPLRRTINDRGRRPGKEESAPAPAP